MSYWSPSRQQRSGDLRPPIMTELYPLTHQQRHTSSDEYRMHILLCEMMKPLLFLTIHSGETVVSCLCWYSKIRNRLVNLTYPSSHHDARRSINTARHRHAIDHTGLWVYSVASFRCGVILFQRVTRSDAIFKVCFNKGWFV